MSHAIIAVPFHGQSLSAVLVDNIPHVALKPLCENIGLDWSAQVQKIKRHAVLKSVMVMITTTGNDGKLYEMLMMPIKYLNGWLFGVDSNRVNPEVKDRVIEYQRECFEVLANHFMPKPQYGLKSLPPSPYISEAEANQFKRSMELHCKGNGSLYKSLYRKVHDYFDITSYCHIPAGKTAEAARVAGIKLVNIKKPKLPPEPQLICMTPLELLAHDQQIAEEAVKRVQGELVSEPSQDGVMLFLKNYSEKERRFLVHTRMNAAQITPVADDCYIMTEDEFIQHFADKKGVFIIDKTKLDEITLKQLGNFLA